MSFEIQCYGARQYVRGMQKEKNGEVKGVRKSDWLIALIRSWWCSLWLLHIFRWFFFFTQLYSFCIFMFLSWHFIQNLTMLQDKALLGFPLSAHAIPSHWDRIQAQLITLWRWLCFTSLHSKQSEAAFIGKKQGISLREHEKAVFCWLILRH